MRKEISKSLLKLAQTNKEFVFLTGDLGFMAFEELEKELGERFVNMGISEQNMISVAASLAHDGLIPFVYSIAPFVVCRPFEQIRNEMGLHNKAVKIIANGGGYGYGIMGSTHHCLEDIALMRSVQNMKIFIPTFNDDVDEVIDLMVADKHPNYLRLNNSQPRTNEIENFKAFRQIRKGSSAVLIGMGPVILNAVELNDAHKLDLDIWTIGIIPFGEFPEELIQKINQTEKVITIEEHYLAGGLSEMIAHQLLKNNSIKKDNIKFDSVYSNGYPSGNYGDQKWHQEENNLAGNSLHQFLKNFLLKSN
jgi:transketolase